MESGWQVVICDSCEAEWWSASSRDVLDAGWKFHQGGGGVLFVMCAACEARYVPRWKELARRAGGLGRAQPG